MEGHPGLLTPGQGARGAAFQTLQDRLVKAMRLARISTIEAANAWLPQYLAQHNARFKRVAADAANAHRAYEGNAQELARICAHHYERRLSKALTPLYVIRLQTPHAPPGGAGFCRFSPTSVWDRLFNPDQRLVWTQKTLAI